MSENEIKAIVSQVVAEMNSHADEISKIKAECEERIADCMNMKADNDKFTSELNERITELTEKVDPELRGGIRCEMAGKRLDNTILTKMDSLRRALSKKS